MALGLCRAAARSLSGEQLFEAQNDCLKGEASQAIFVCNLVLFPIAGICKSDVLFAIA